MHTRETNFEEVRRMFSLTLAFQKLCKPSNAVRRRKGGRQCPTVLIETSQEVEGLSILKT